MWIIAGKCPRVTMKTTRAIESRYDAMARQLSAPTALVHFATAPQHDGSAHVEQDGDTFCYVVTERGQELERRRTTDVEELLFWLASDLTWAMAIDYEISHRIPGQDFRRLLFQKHLELLAELSPKWSQSKGAEYERVLADHPFCDEDG